ncbi:MAG: hypothetical protein SFU55_00650 [Methylophilus sp.]|nr:hypothetical protein [Methylophilus sp.]
MKKSILTLVAIASLITGLPAAAASDSKAKKETVHTTKEVVKSNSVQDTRDERHEERLEERREQLRERHLEEHHDHHEK